MSVHRKNSPCWPDLNHLVISFPSHCKALLQQQRQYSVCFYLRLLEIRWERSCGVVCCLLYHDNFNKDPVISNNPVCCWRLERRLTFPVCFSLCAWRNMLLKLFSKSDFDSVVWLQHELLCSTFCEVVMNEKAKVQSSCSAFKKHKRINDCS